MFGERVIGKEAAERAAREAQNDQGGGAIQFGERVLGHEFQPKPPPPGTEPAPPTPPSTSSKNRVVKPAAEPAPAAPVDPAQVAFTELEVEAMLTEDPNLWPRVMEAEAKRPDGPRPAVATMLIDVGDLATEPPIPTKLLAEFARIVAAATPAHPPKLASK